MNATVTFLIGMLVGGLITDICWAYQIWSKERN